MKRMGGIAILLAIPAQAQRSGRMRGPAGPDEIGNRERARNLSADAIIRKRENLNLSEEQVERIKEAQEADRAVRDAQRLETLEMRDRLRDEEITRGEFWEELQSRRSSTMDGRRAHREALEGILSDEQRHQMRGLRTRVNRGQRARGGRAGPHRLSRPRARTEGTAGRAGPREASGPAYAAEL
jgi:hypothetical protein